MMRVLLPYRFRLGQYAVGVLIRQFNTVFFFEKVNHYSLPVVHSVVTFTNYTVNLIMMSTPRNAHDGSVVML